MTKRAVCVGINDYSGFSATIPSLTDARQDGDAWAALLPDVFGFDAANVTLLTDTAASRAAVLGGVQTMLAASEAGDVACLFFAGHGGRRADGNGLYHETICCADANGQIRDSEFNAMADALAPSTVDFTLVLDSCHSGGVFDVPPPDVTPRSLPWSSDEADAMASACRGIVPHVLLGDPEAMAGNCAVSRVDAGTLSMTIDENLNYSDGAKATLLAACRYDENSSGNGSHGLFTQSLLDVINACGMQVTHPDLLDRVRTAIKAYTTKQTPQLRGRPVRLDESFLQGWNYSI